MSELIETSYNNIIQCTLILAANIYIVYNLIQTTLGDIDQTTFPYDENTDDKQDKNTDDKQDENTDDIKEKYVADEDEENTDDIKEKYVVDEDVENSPYPIRVPFISHMSQLAVFLLCLMLMFLLLDIVIDILSFERLDKTKSVYDFKILLKTFFPLLLSAILCNEFNKLYETFFVDKEELNKKSYVKLQIVCLFIADIIIVTAVFVLLQIKAFQLFKYQENYFKLSESTFIIWLKKKFSKK